MKPQAKERQSLYYKPLSRILGRFVEPAIEDDRGLELTPVDQMDSFLGRFYERVEGDVEIGGRSFRVPVHVPRSGDGKCYCIVDSTGFPPQQGAADDEEAKRIFSYSKWVIDKLAFTEGLAHDQLAYIESEFLNPLLTELDPADYSKELRSISCDAALDRRRCIVFGAPGTGKTTMLRWLALRLCKQAEGNASNMPVPIYFQLRDWPDESTADQVLSKLTEGTFAFQSGEVSLSSLSESGRMILLLDGLDEVPDSKRSAITDVILRLAQDKPKIGIILTARTASYRGGFNGFSKCVLRPFDDSRILEWSYKKLYSSDRTTWLRFISHLSEVPHFKEVSRNPFMLGLAVHFYRHNSILPKNTATLLESYIRAVAGEWDTVRGITRSSEMWASPSKKLSALCRLAFWMVDSGKTIFSTNEFLTIEKALADHHSPDSLLSTLAEHTGVLARVEHRKDVWRFSHQTLMEFLAAYYLVERPDDVSKVFKKRFVSPVWADIWTYSCGLAQDAGPLIKLLLTNTKLSEFQKARLVARAFAQNLNIEKRAVETGSDLIVKTLRKLLKNYVARSAQSHSIDSNCLWSASIERKKTGHGRGNVQIDEIADLLREIYCARGGVFSRYLERYRSHGKDDVVTEVFKALAYDGDFKTESNQADGAIRLIVNRRSLL
jgi:hypothetical protein